MYSKISKIIKQVVAGIFPEPESEKDWREKRDKRKNRPLPLWKKPEELDVIEARKISNSIKKSMTEVSESLGDGAILPGFLKDKEWRQSKIEIDDEINARKNWDKRLEEQSKITDNKDVDSTLGDGVNCGGVFGRDSEWRKTSSLDLKLRSLEERYLGR